MKDQIKIKGSIFMRKRRAGNMRQVGASAP